MSDQENTKVLYTIEDLCDMLRVSRSLVYKALSSGELASVKVGARRLVSSRQLEAYIQLLESRADHATNR